MDKQFFWNITLMVGAIRCFSIPFFCLTGGYISSSKNMCLGWFDWCALGLFILYGTRCTKHLNDHCRHNFTGKCCIRQGGQGSSTDFHFPVRYRISLQRCRRWLSDGQYYWWWFYPHLLQQYG